MILKTVCFFSENFFLWEWGWICLHMRLPLFKANLLILNFIFFEFFFWSKKWKKKVQILVEIFQNFGWFWKQSCKRLFRTFLFWNFGIKRKTTRFPISTGKEISKWNLEISQNWHWKRVFFFFLEIFGIFAPKIKLFCLQLFIYFRYINSDCSFSFPTSRGFSEYQILFENTSNFFSGL